MNEKDIEELKSKAAKLAEKDKNAGAAFMSSLHPLIKDMDPAVRTQLVTIYRRAWGEDAPTLVGW